MGLLIECQDPTAPLPHQVCVTLTCDGPTGLFPPAQAAFVHSDGYVGAHAAAMKAGWLERQTPQGRIFLCPDCSGKLSVAV